MSEDSQFTDEYLNSLTKHDWDVLDLTEEHHESAGLQGYSNWERFRFHTRAFYVFHIQKWWYGVGGKIND
jgi:hypothetical protein